MRMTNSTVASHVEPKAISASTLLHKPREMTQKTGTAEVGPTRHYPIDLGRVPLYPPGGPPRSKAGVLPWLVNGFAMKSDGRDVEPAALSQAPSGRLTTTRGVLQTKLQVGSANDPLEQEADQVAEKVLRMPDPAGSTRALSGMPVTRASPGLSRKCAACEKENDSKGAQVQRRAAHGATAGQAEAPPIVEETLSGGGRPLDAGALAYFEPRFGFDLSKIRIHADARAAESARAVNAHAYTVGRDIVFGQGRYAPGDREGRRLLAHELAHVMQQMQPTGGATSHRPSPGEPRTRGGGPDSGVLAAPAPKPLHLGNANNAGVVRREDFDGAGADAASCKDKAADDTARCSDKVNTACTLLGAGTTGEFALAGGLLAAAPGAVVGGIIGGFAGAYSYGKCVERMNAKCRARGAATARACDAKFAAAPAPPKSINVNDLPDANPPINVNDLPDAHPSINVNDLPDAHPSINVNDLPDAR